MMNIDSLSVGELESLRDACSRRLLELRKTQGLSLPEMLRLLEEVKVVLRDQGKEWHSLDSWQWMDGEVHFWLNPRDQESYNPGWFSIDELISWSRNRGPVMLEEEIEEDEHLWQVADGVQITWLPRDTSEDAVGNREQSLIDIY